MTHAQLILNAEGLVTDADRLRRKIAKHEPHRLPLADLMVDDAVRAYALIEAKPRLSGRDRMLLAAWYTRALVMSEALQAPVQ